MKFALDYENAIANRGNLFQLKRVMERAMAGEMITLESERLQQLQRSQRTFLMIW